MKTDQYILTIDPDGRPNKYSKLDPFFSTGQLFKIGKVIMIIESVNLKDGIAKFRPILSEELKKIEEWHKNYYGNDLMDRK